MDPFFDQGYTEMPCAICGREFTPTRDHRCRKCARFVCRDCLKVHYYFDMQGCEIPTQTLCYDCFHAMYDKPWQDDD